MSSYIVAAGLAGALALASQAEAQTAPAPTPAPAAKADAAKAGEAKDGATVSGVVVTGQSDGYRATIDKRSYSLKNDLAATNGSIADALRNVPSVEVDVQGNVSLRGDSSVTILIDGKPSGVMKGQARADALQQIPADRFERVEVMTNPSAAYSAEGTGGVINLITKKAKGAGASGTVKASLGDGGRKTVGISGGYNSSKLNLSGDASVRRNRFAYTADEQRTVAGLSYRDVTSARMRGYSWNLHGSAAYEVTPKDRVSLDLSAGRGPQDSESRVVYSGASAPLAITGRTSTFKNAWHYTDADLSWRRQLGEDRDLTLELDQQGSGFRSDRDSTVFPVGALSFETLGIRTDTDITALKLTYNQPMAGQAKLKAGLEYQTSDSDTGTRLLRGPSFASQTVDALSTHAFTYDEDIATAYATYDRPFGDWTVQGGLRLEAVQGEVQSGTAGRFSHDYTRLYPSLHLGYKIDDNRQLTASYSHRIQRPESYRLDPYRTYVDAYTYQQGNPNLDPSETHSWEAAYQYRKGAAYYLLTGFYRSTYNEVTDVVRDLGGGVSLATVDNIGQRKSGGVEFNANGRLTPKLTYNLTGSAYWNQVGAQFGAPERSATSGSLRGGINWQATPKDLLQLAANGAGKRLTGQGYMAPAWTANLGYRHKFNDKIALTVTANDLFDSARNHLTIDTPTVKQDIKSKFSARSVYIGVSYAFGAKRPQRESFDYDSGAGGGGGPR